ncbi:hypothetical protein EGR_09426 [Echinococcus granulosus]|uniref:Uncharacterized protein n=1 Tax=Echinococcus granulosus TaxID=6210 RepID=W6U3N5_ECHGR|nr:hypothetical protein EGR_09426 [Echinococcus granulosus]EUB55713.1 hypothetical protein EGR_09426 [Echinococcus granulosus]
MVYKILGSGFASRVDSPMPRIGKSSMWRKEVVKTDAPKLNWTLLWHSKVVDPLSSVKEFWKSEILLIILNKPWAVLKLKSDPNSKQFPPICKIVNLEKRNPRFSLSNRHATIMSLCDCFSCYFRLHFWFLVSGEFAGMAEGGGRQTISHQREVANAFRTPVTTIDEGEMLYLQVCPK